MRYDVNFLMRHGEKMTEQAEQLTLTLDFPGMRLDRALAEAHPALSRAQWQKMLREKAVLIDGRPPAKSSAKLRGGEVAVVTIPAVTETELIPEDIPLTVLFEDAHLLVVNKAAGMVVHPAVGNETGTLVNAILHHCPDLEGIGNEKRPGIVHRLDKDTSGAIVVAKNDHALRTLQAQFADRTVEKTYLALVDGYMLPEKAFVDAPIGRDPKHRKKMVVIPRGSSHTAREAQTEYAVTQRYEKHSMVRCHPKTGRTHQIRVHLAYVGFPIVGDRVYGRRKQELLPERHFLHAAELAFAHPVTGEMMRVTAALPPELQAILDQLPLMTAKSA